MLTPPPKEPHWFVFPTPPHKKSKKKPHSRIVTRKPGMTVVDVLNEELRQAELEDSLAAQEKTLVERAATPAAISEKPNPERSLASKERTNVRPATAPAAISDELEITFRSDLGQQPPPKKARFNPTSEEPHFALAQPSSRTIGRFTVTKMPANSHTSVQLEATSAQPSRTVRFTAADIPPIMRALTQPQIASLQPSKAAGRFAVTNAPPSAHISVHPQNTSTQPSRTVQPQVMPAQPSRSVGRFTVTDIPPSSRTSLQSQHTSTQPSQSAQSSQTIGRFTVTKMSARKQASLEPQISSAQPARTAGRFTIIKVEPSKHGPKPALKKPAVSLVPEKNKYKPQISPILEEGEPSDTSDSRSPSGHFFKTSMSAQPSNSNVSKNTGKSDEASEAGGEKWKKMILQPSTGKGHQLYFEIDEEVSQECKPTGEDSNQNQELPSKKRRIPFFKVFDKVVAQCIQAEEAFIGFEKRLNNIERLHEELKKRIENRSQGTH